MAGDAKPPDPLIGHTSRVPLSLLAVLVLIAVVIGLAVAMGPLFSGAQILLVVGAIGGVAFALVAVQRFWWLLVVLFTVRASLDALKPSEGGGLEAGTIVGAIFLAAAGAWLFVQWRSGELERISASGKMLVVLGAGLLLSTPGAKLPFESLQAVMKYVAVAVMFVVLEQIFLKDPDRIATLLLATFASLIVPAIVGFTQVGSTEPSTVPGAADVDRIQGTFVHPNMFGAYLVIVGLLAVALLPYLPRWRGMLIAVILLVLPLLVLTYARGAWIGLYIGLVFIGLAQSRALLVALFSATILIALTVPSVTDRLSDLDIAAKRQHEQIDANSAEWRIDYWQRVLPLVEDSPGPGIGLGMIPHETPEEAPAHSAYVDVIVEGGIVGFGLLIGMIGTLWVALRRAGRRLTHGPPRGVAVAAAAIGLALIFQFFSESLLTQPAILWYAVAPMAWAISAGRSHPAHARLPGASVPSPA
jgi:O-antigen ligase